MFVLGLKSFGPLLLISTNFWTILCSAFIVFIKASWISSHIFFQIHACLIFSTALTYWVCNQQPNIFPHCTTCQHLSWVEGTLFSAFILGWSFWSWKGPMLHVCINFQYASQIGNPFAAVHVFQLIDADQRPMLPHHSRLLPSHIGLPAQLL